MSLLSRQLAAFRQEHALPEGLEGKSGRPPSLLFSPQEAKQYDSDAFAALALRGIAEASVLDPDIAAFAPMFKGSMPDRELLTREESERLNREIRRFLLLLSPHFPTRAAQQCIEGLLFWYHVHRWNVDDVLACGLPYHDSPTFTRLLQTLHVEGKPRWAWLHKLKVGPTTLVRSALAKYCTKDFSVLAFVSDLVQEVVRLQKAHRALATFFAAVWLDTLALVGSVSPDLVEIVVPVLKSMLHKPYLSDNFYAALSVAGALCVKADLEGSAQKQLLERAARQVAGDQGLPAAALLTLFLQLQASDAVPDKALKLLSAAGPGALAGALPPGLDCSNLLAMLIEACLSRAIAGPEAEEESRQMQSLVEGLLADAALVDRYAAPLSLGALQAFCRALPGQPAGGCQRATEVVQGPIAALGDKHSMALGAAFRRAVDVTLECGLGTEPLVQLMAPVCAAVPSESSSGSFVPLFQSFSHKSAKVRNKAVQAAVEDLAKSAEGDNSRQRLLVSLVLQAADDEIPEVARKTLQLEAIWATLPQVAADAAVPVLESGLRKLMDGAKAHGDSQLTMFQSVLFQNARAHSLAAPILNCFAWVYARSDCDEDLRQKIDGMLLPFLFLCLVGLDLMAAAGSSINGADTGSQFDATELRSAVLHFCKVSKHPILAHLKSASPAGGAGLAVGPLSDAVGRALDAQAAERLSQLVEGQPWLAAIGGGELGNSGSPAAGMVGGLAVQGASAMLLACGLHRLLQGGPDEAAELVVRCAEACRRLAWHLSLLDEATCDCTEPLRQLVKAVLAGAARLDEQERGQAPAPEKKGKSHRNNHSKDGRRHQMIKVTKAVRELLRLSLERPRTLATELRMGLTACGPLLQPALLHIAFGKEILLSSEAPREGCSSSAVIGNALALIRSLLVSPSAPDWVPDQSLMLPLIARLAGAKAREVRAAALGVLEAFHDASQKGAQVRPGWRTPCTAALCEAGVFRNQGEVLPAHVWSALEPEPELLSMPGSVCGTFLEHMVAHKAEILQDCDAVVLAFSKFFVGKHCNLRLSRVKACSFWGIGFSMLTQRLSIELPSLLAAIPASGFFGCLKKQLQLCVQETVSKLKVSATLEPPLILHTAAMEMIEMVRKEKLRDGLNEKTQAAEADTVDSFVRKVALPFCAGLAESCEAGGLLFASSMVELAELICQSVVCAMAWPTADKFKADVVGGLFRMCVATLAAPAGPGQDQVKLDPAAAGATARIATAASAALAEVPMDGRLLHGLLLHSPTLKGAQLQSPGGTVAAELFCRQVVGFTGPPAPGAGELLVALGKAAQDAAAGWVQAPEESDGPLPHILLAIAALSEHLSGGEEFGQFVPPTCCCIGEVCRTLGQRLTSGKLAAIVRACGALAPMAPPPSDSDGKASRAPPTPLQVCVEALRNFAHPLTADTLSLLKGYLHKLWRYPEAAVDVGMPLSIRRWDVLAQSRLRLLLHTVMANQSALLEVVDTDFCMSLAESAGLWASLDFVLMLLLIRRNEKPAVAKKKKSKSRKRGAADIDGIEDELPSELLPSNDVDENAVDEAGRLLTSVGTSCRYHCLGMLMQTICSLASELCPVEHDDKKSVTLSWGQALLPRNFLQDVGKEKAFRLLDMGLIVVSRFVRDHGLPAGLDDADVDVASCRSLVGDDTADENAAAATAACYVTWAACTAEVLLRAPGVAETAGVRSCRQHAHELQELLLRSLVVNHPATFCRTACLALQIPTFCPPSPDDDIFAVADFRFSQTIHVTGVVGEALRERHELREGSGADGGMDEDAQAACSPLCAAMIKHVSQNFLSGGATLYLQNLSVVSWRLLDVLCKFIGSTAPKPVLEFCFPAAIRCLEEFAGKGAKAPTVSMATACCLFLQTAITQLGRGILDLLNQIMVPVLDLIDKLAAGAGADGGVDLELLEKSMLRTLQALVHSVGPFMSPFLGRVLAVVTAPAAAWKTELLEELGRDLVARIPQRLLLPAAQSSVITTKDSLASFGDTETAMADLDSALVRMQRLAILHALIFAGTSPEAVAADADAAAAGLLQQLDAGTAAVGAFFRAGGRQEDMSSRLLRWDFSGQAPPSKDSGQGPAGLKWAECCMEGGVQRLHTFVAMAFTQFALRFDVDALKPRVMSILQWARNSQAQTLAEQKARKRGSKLASVPADSCDACRTLAVFSALHSITVEAPGIATQLLLPLVFKDLASCLVASRCCARDMASSRGAPLKKRRRAAAGASSSWATGGPSVASELLEDHTGWWFEVSVAALHFIGAAFAPADEGATQARGFEEMMDELTDPCADTLDTCGIIPPSDESPLSRVFLEAIQAAFVSLAAASDGPRIKKLVLAVLTKSRSNSAEVRLCTVRCCHKIWTDLGVQVGSCLSEVVMYASELLEDEDPRVEAAVRSMIKTIERCTGESLQESLKR